MQKRRDVFHYLRQKRYSIYFLQDKIWTRNSTNTSQRIGVLVRILVPIIQDLDVWPYFLIIILNSRSKGYLGTMEEKGCFASKHIWAKKRRSKFVYTP